MQFQNFTGSPVPIEMVPYDPEWSHAFRAESQQIKAVLGKTAVRIHHIGSTSIPGIYAKPIIDMLVEANEITEIDRHNDAMTDLAYQVMGEFGIRGRRYFRKETAEGKRTHHVHIFQVGSPDVMRHLIFRDYMIAHADAAQQYSDLKRSLVARVAPGDMAAYMDGKDSFIKEMQTRAIAWSSSQDGP